MVLCPEFLPRDQPQQAPVATAPPPEPVAPAATEVPVAEPVGASARAATPRERLSGTLQYVFGSGDPGFSVDETFGGAVEADAPPARRAGASASGVETHHLA
jgi:hypothetical protein